jgi:hypothetical protein
MTPPAPIIVGPSPLKILGSVAIVSVVGVALVFVLIQVMAVLATPWPLLHAGIILACTTVVLASYCVIALLVAIVWGRPRVEIRPDGFIDSGAAGSRSRRWSDIEGGFVVIRVWWQPKVAYRLTDAFKQSTRIKPIAALAGYDEAILICGELAIGAAALAEILNQHKQRAADATVTDQPPMESC